MFARSVCLFCISSVMSVTGVCAESPEAGSSLRVVLRTEALYTVVVSGVAPRKVDLVSVSLDGRATVERHALVESSLRQIGRVEDVNARGGLIIDDRESKQLLLVSLAVGALPKEAWSLENMDLVRTMIGESMHVAIRAALGYE